MDRPHPTESVGEVLCALGRDAEVRHVVDLPAVAGELADWPSWIDPDLRAAYARCGITKPWAHQVAAAELAWAGHDVGLVTGTASGKSAAYGMPGITAALQPSATATGRGPAVLYVAPTKALAHDQLVALGALGLPLLAAAYDGDTPAEERAWARAHARWLVTNPDMLHRSILPDHDRWRGFLAQLRFVVVDEAHAYRGVFGAHVALVLRRLARLAAMHGATPAFFAASATTSNAETSLHELLGRPVRVVDVDASQRPGRRLVFWQPAEIADPSGRLRRRGAVTESARIMAALVSTGVQTLAFTRSRRAAEAVAGLVRSADPANRVAAYRGGYLPEERRELESDLRRGRLRGLSATSALELGIDVSGLDAVILAGWPGSRTSFWQQVGRAGRRGRDAAAVLVAREDPLDQFLVHNPGYVIDNPVESTARNTQNPYILAPHLCAAAAEHRLGHDELAAEFGPIAPDVCQQLGDRGVLRRRRTGWYWTSQGRPSDLTDLRGTSGSPVRIVEDGSGRLLGTVDPSAAHHQVHPGAVYVHQGQSHVITFLDTDAAVAGAVRAEVDYDTYARSNTFVTLGQVHASLAWGYTALFLGEVQVTTRVTSFLKRRWPGGEVLGEFPLDLPELTLPTTATWWVISDQLLATWDISPVDVPGTVHAAEHAAIGLLPLVAGCDRWDIGGVSMAVHPQTDAATVVVYDGTPGGAGFAESGFKAAPAWLSATLAAIEACPCGSGCPSCVQSPKCGNGNEPLDKAGARRLLRGMLAGAPAQPGRPASPNRIPPG